MAAAQPTLTAAVESRGAALPKSVSVSPAAYRSVAAMSVIAGSASAVRPSTASGA
eukprot:CAMPEP_0115869462 /NCGR_PEP_ID=MMETSP0287-20121206/21822_1 /TAXON_ID=412157 /ORGANISM="Chrysochromulina rotalis, Strain UIO044" /LENGTH=54 /DNA_ID=CAMNT_0003324151 /DNA_START=150 /DNA_END=314 /DNA_ORIENTATION=-